MKGKSILFFVVIIMWLGAPHSYALDIDASFSRIHIKDVCSAIIISDAEQGRSLSAQDMLHSDAWLPCAEVSLARGFTEEKIWLKFELKNITNSYIPLYMNTYPSWISNLDVYIFEQGLLNHYDSYGTHKNFIERPIPTANVIFPIPLKPAQERTVLMFVDSNTSLVIGGSIDSNVQMLTGVVTLNLLNGLIIGGVLLIGLYNLFIFLGVRDYSYLYYCLYAFSMVLMLSSTYGFGYQILWPKHSYFNYYSMVVAGPLNAVFVSVFLRDFLNLHRVSKIMDTILKLIMYISLAVVVLAAFPGFIDLAPAWSEILLMIVGPIVLVSAVLASKTGETSARIFLSAWIFSLVSFTFLGLMINGVIEFTFVRYYGFGLCVLIEMSLLSFALASKIRSLQADKYHADLAVLDAKVKHEKELADAEDSLEHKVKLRTFDLASEKRRAELQAKTDPLTGLKNRRAFFDIGTKLFNDIDRSSEYDVLAVVMIDIDFFKQINDDYGHNVGDSVIAAVSLSLLPFYTEDSMESVFGRIGGEEFGVVLKGIGGKAALEKSEAARRHISQMNIPVSTNDTIKVSVSIGVAEYRAGDKSIDATLVRADMALYQAKEAGRNRSVLATDTA